MGACFEHCSCGWKGLNDHLYLRVCHSSWLWLKMILPMVYEMSQIILYVGWLDIVSFIMGTNVVFLRCDNYYWGFWKWTVKWPDLTSGHLDLRVWCVQLQRISRRLLWLCQAVWCLQVNLLIENSLVPGPERYLVSIINLFACHLQKRNQ